MSGWRRYGICLRRVNEVVGGIWGNAGRGREISPHDDQKKQNSTQSSQIDTSPSTYRARVIHP